MQNQAKKLDMQKLLAPLALVILYIVFSIFGTNFLSLDMVKNILESSYYIGFMAFGVTFIIITGGIDLSLGTVMMCAALLGGYTFKQGWPLIASVVLTILVGVVFGFINGNLVAKLRLPPFIATLGTQMMAGGLGSLITKVQSQTWPTATAEVGGWFKKVFIRAELFGVKGCLLYTSSTSVVHRLPKPRRRVRFPYPAPKRNAIQADGISFWFYLFYDALLQNDIGVDRRFTALEDAIGIARLLVEREALDAAEGFFAAGVVFGDDLLILVPDGHLHALVLVRDLHDLNRVLDVFVQRNDL